MLSSLVLFGILATAAPVPAETASADIQPASVSDLVPAQGCADGAKPWLPGTLRTQFQAPTQDQTAPRPQYGPAPAKPDCAVV